MQLEKLSIWADIRRVFNSGPKNTKYQIEAILHTEKDDIKVLLIKNIDEVRDYGKNIGSEIFIEFELLLGTYVKKVYPYRPNLELTLKFRALSETGDGFLSNSKITTERYKAIFLENENLNIKGSEYDNISSDELDILTSATVKLQLLNRALEPFRIKMTGGTFTNVNQRELIHGIVGGESQKIVVDGVKSIHAIDIVKPDNQDKATTIIIPQLTAVVNLPTLLQERYGGVYSSGLGNFLQKYDNRTSFFVYPLYDTKRFEENVRKAIFYNLPRDRFLAVERTYRRDGDITHILVSGGKSFKDEGEASMMNDGVGFRMSNAIDFMKKPVEMTLAGPKAVRKKFNTEVTNEKRKDGLNYAPVSGNAISANNFAQYSRIAERLGGRIDVTWENADPSQFYPGMPCKYIYVENNRSVEVKGIVLYVHVYYQMLGRGLDNKTYSCTCIVGIFAERTPYGGTPTVSSDKPPFP